MKRRVFDHLFAEISVVVGIRVPRYGLWLELQDLGWNPESISPKHAVAFIDAGLRSFLGERGLAITPRAVRRLRKLIARFDPNQPTPYERFESWGRAR